MDPMAAQSPQRQFLLQVSGMSMPGVWEAVSQCKVCWFVSQRTRKFVVTVYVFFSFFFPVMDCVPTVEIAQKRIHYCVTHVKEQFC